MILKSCQMFKFIETGLMKHKIYWMKLNLYFFFKPSCIEREIKDIPFKTTGDSYPDPSELFRQLKTKAKHYNNN